MSEQQEGRREKEMTDERRRDQRCADGWGGGLQMKNEADDRSGLIVRATSADRSLRTQQIAACGVRTQQISPSWTQPISAADLLTCLPYLPSISDAQY